MEDIIIIAVLLVIIAAAARYVYKAKKSGAKCIGCAVEGGCKSSCGCGCGGASKDYSSETNTCCHKDAH